MRGDGVRTNFREEGSSDRKGKGDPHGAGEKKKIKIFEQPY